MFGVGRYTFAPYKVGVSGFYKQPMFSLLCTKDKRPVMTDDTSYFLCFDSYEMAYIAMLLLNNEQIQKFLSGITFADAKRPYTKKVLQRIDFHKVVDAISFDEVKQTERNLFLSEYAEEQMYQEFIRLVRGKSNLSSDEQLSMFAMS